MSYCKVNNCYNYTTKINIYDNINFIPLPTVRAPLPPCLPIYIPLNECGKQYVTPNYFPPAPCCNGINNGDCSCSGKCKT
jgi:hypothetical protein